MARSVKLSRWSVARGFAYIALWQCAVFLILILLVWVNEVYDLTALWFGASASPPDLTRGCLASAAMLMGLIIVVGNTYLQQQRAVAGLLTICSYCHNIRIDHEVWQRVEAYIVGKSSVEFTHGICPPCFEKIAGELQDSVSEGSTAG